MVCGDTTFQGGGWRRCSFRASSSGPQPCSCPLTPCSPPKESHPARTHLFPQHRMTEYHLGAGSPWGISHGLQPYPIPPPPLRSPLEDSGLSNMSIHFHHRLHGSLCSVVLWVCGLLAEILRPQWTKCPMLQHSGTSCHSEYKDDLNSGLLHPSRGMSCL